LRALLVLALIAGWRGQTHQQLSVVDVYLTDAQASPHLAPRVRHYPAGVPWVCVYLIYGQGRPGVDRYSYHFAHETSVFFEDVEHRVTTAHGVALDCFPTGGALAPGPYVAQVLINGRIVRQLPFTVDMPIGAP
jgi:hypothetical protein